MSDSQSAALKESLGKPDEPKDDTKKASTKKHVFTDEEITAIPDGQGFTTKDGVALDTNRHEVTDELDRLRRYCNHCGYFWSDDDTHPYEHPKNEG